MKLTTLLFATALAVASAAEDGSAQNAPYNRRLDGIGVTPTTTPGIWDVQAAWTVELGTQLADTLELSTEVVVLVNGVEAASEFVSIQALVGAGGCGNCAPGCGEGAVNGMAAALLCLSEGQVGCSCQFPPFTSSMPVPLDPGDDVVVWLRAIPGAAPELDSNDDRRTTDFDGTPIGWNRGLVDAELVPSAIPGLFDLEIEWSVLLSQLPQEGLELTPEIEVWSGGQVVGIFELPCGPWIAAPGLGCALVNCPGDPCATISCNGASHVLRCYLTETNTGLQYCACLSEAPFSVVVPGISLSSVPPGGQVDVLLKPAPGALPELPGFAGDERKSIQVPTNPWKDLGDALAGKVGEPHLSGAGPMVGGDPIELTLTKALDDAKAWLVIGLASLGAPFKGGVLVPDPSAPGLVLPFPTDAAGEAQLVAPLPLGLPSGFELYAQWWIQDEGGPVGFAASNAVLGTTP